MRSNDVTIKKISLIGTKPNNESSIICKRITKNHKDLRADQDFKCNLDACLLNNQINSKLETSVNKIPAVNVNVFNHDIIIIHI